MCSSVCVRAFVGVCMCVCVCGGEGGARVFLYMCVCLFSMTGVQDCGGDL